MAGGNVALGDREETRQPRFRRQEIIAIGIEGGLGHEKSDRKQLTHGVEQTSELRSHRDRPERIFQRDQSGDPRHETFGRYRNVRLVGKDRGERRLRPEEKIGAGSIAALERDRTRDIHRIVGFAREIGEGRGLCRIRSRRVPARLGQVGERNFELPRCHGLRNPTEAKMCSDSRGQFAHIDDAGETDGGARRRRFPLAAGVGESDKMARQIAAVDRRNIFGFQHAQVVNVIPIEKVATEARHALHGGQCRFQTLHRLRRGDPTKIARACDGKQTEANIGWRSPMRQHRRRIFLKIIGGQHMVFGGNESLEKPPGEPRDVSQRLAIRIGDDHRSFEPRSQADIARDGWEDEP